LVGDTGRTVTNFSLRDTKNNNKVSLADYPEAKGFIIVFTCNHCPFAKLYPKRLKALQTRYAALGVPLIAISSTSPLLYEEDSYQHMKEVAERGNYNFPYLYDAKQMVAKQFRAKKTPHAFVIWKTGNQWIIRYSGAIDDNGAEPEKVEHPYVADAVDALLAGKAVPEPETGSVGCEIMYGKR
jgi:peroxiredoxin